MWVRLVLTMMTATITILGMDLGITMALTITIIHPTTLGAAIIGADEATGEVAVMVMDAAVSGAAAADMAVVDMAAADIIRGIDA